ncbi:MAG TPA: SDR family oxidoreductase [Burkholderiaceae bacterium]|nr:SDR family oxidoreductase [Burkholderiaceae bacterium]
MRRVIRPEEIGELAAYLLSPGAAGMTGQSILYDGSVLQV